MDEFIIGLIDMSLNGLMNNWKVKWIDEFMIGWWNLWLTEYMNGCGLIYEHNDWDMVGWMNISIMNIWINELNEFWWIGR